MNRGKIPVAEYREFAKQFNPVKYDPEDWVKLAKAAGMKYIIITSKHHDGFALFDSKATSWDIVDATPYKKDLLKPLAEACQKHGIKLGFYYSQAQDWTHAGGAASGGHWDKEQDGSMDVYIQKIAVPQVREILSNYGKIAVLWWDTPVNMNKERADLLLPLIQLQPGIIINNRLGGGYKGDSDTPEQTIPATGMPGRDWETCMTMNGTWGYKSYDQNWKSASTLIKNLVDIASKGGNYLLNVGPTPEGLIPEPSVERLKEIGAWMDVNNEAIYATSPSPFKRLPWGRCTQKQGRNEITLYLHVFNWPSDGKLLAPGLKNKAQTAYLLSDKSKKPLTTVSTSDGLCIEVPEQAPDSICSVLVLKVKGPLSIVQLPPMQDADGSVVLPAEDALLHGGRIQYEGAENRNCIGFWTESNDWAEWQFQFNKPGKFTVAAELASLEDTSFEILLGEQKLTGKAIKTGDYGKFKQVNLGTVEISQTGKLTLAVKPKKEWWKPMNLTSIRLPIVK
jgi:alpha-L-fucosidase